MLYTRFIVRKRSVFSTKVVFYKSNIFSHLLALDANIHSIYFPPLSLLHKHSPHRLWNSTVKVLSRFFFILFIYFWEVKNQKQWLPSEWATVGCTSRLHLQLMLAWSLHFQFISDQVCPPFLILFLIIQIFTAPSCDAEDQDVHLIRHSHSTNLCRSLFVSGKELKQQSNNLIITCKVSII